MSQPVLTLTDAAIAQRDRVILEAVNFELQRGEFAYLIGRTGSGKSSLLRTLYADLPLAAGTAHIVGHDLSGLSAKAVPELRRKLGIVFQDFKLLDDRNVGDNLRFVLRATGWKDRENIELQVQDRLDRVGLRDKVAAMPYELSGGEQQRVVIARALLNTPQLILADEPTGNLDPDTAQRILKLLREIASISQVGVLFATHDYQLIEQHPARIIRCEGGRVHLDKYL